MVDPHLKHNRYGGEFLEVHQQAKKKNAFQQVCMGSETKLQKSCETKNITQQPKKQQQQQKQAHPVPSLNLVAMEWVLS